MKNILSFNENTNIVRNNFYITLLLLYLVAYSLFYYILPMILPISLIMSAVIFSACIAAFLLFFTKIIIQIAFFIINNIFQVSFEKYVAKIKILQNLIFKRSKLRYA